MFDSRDFRNLMNRQVGTHEMVYWETLGNQLEKLFQDTRYWTSSPIFFPQSCCFFQEKTWTEGNGSIRTISDHFFLCRCCLGYFFPSLPLVLGRSIWICTPLFGSFIKFRFSDVQCLGSAVFSDAHQLSLLCIAVWRRQRALGIPWDVASCEISNESIWWLQSARTQWSHCQAPSLCCVAVP